VGKVSAEKSPCLPEVFRIAKFRQRTRLCGKGIGRRTVGLRAYRSMGERGLRDLHRDFVVAGFAASAAVEKPVFAQPDIQLALAEDAILLAVAALFNLLALAAANFDFSGCHEGTLAPVRKTAKVPLVTRGRL
jgi:hypothetical protein